MEATVAAAILQNPVFYQKSIRLSIPSKQSVGRVSERFNFAEKSLGKRTNSGLGPFLNRRTIRTEIHFSTYPLGASKSFETKHRCKHMISLDHFRPQRQCHCFGVKLDTPSAILNQDADGFLLNSAKMNFIERFALAWKILFPTNTDRRNSNANIAKQRLKMILFADRCAVSDEAKQKIVSNIIKALSDFVEIEPQDKVQLSVSTDVDLGTVYSVMVPVRRVKPGYQQSDEEFAGITGIEVKDTGETSGCVDIKFDFHVPS